MHSTAVEFPAGFLHASLFSFQPARVNPGAAPCCDIMASKITDGHLPQQSQLNHLLYAKMGEGELRLKLFFHLYSCSLKDLSAHTGNSQSICSKMQVINRTYVLSANKGELPFKQGIYGYTVLQRPEPLFVFWAGRWLLKRPSSPPSLRRDSPLSPNEWVEPRVSGLSSSFANPSASGGLSSHGRL